MKNVNLGKYDLKKMLRNPGLIHKIQDKLMAIQEDNFLATVIKEGAKTDIGGCIKMIVEYYYDNPKKIQMIVDKETIELIEEFLGVTFADDLNNLNI